MKETAIYKAWIKLKTDLAPMSMKERVDHLWTYYKGTVIVVSIFAVLIISLIVSTVTKKDVFLGGIHSNVELTDEEWSYIEDGFMEAQKGNPHREEISILDTILTKIQDDEYYEMNYYYLQAVIARVGAQHADYILSDKVALEIFMTQDMLLDLREFFTEEQLEMWQDRLIYLLPVDENGEPTTDGKYPVAIDISGMSTLPSVNNSKKPVYFSVAINSLHMDRVHEFWDYLTVAPKE